MDALRILAGVVTVNGTDIIIKWEEVSIDRVQLSHFQKVLMKEQPHLNVTAATGIILKHRIKLTENDGLIFFTEGMHVFGSEASNLKTENALAIFSKELNRYNKIGEMNNWSFEKVKHNVIKKNKL